MALKERVEKIEREIPAVFLALHRKTTPVLAKILAWATVAYALSPVDLIPDFIPLLGYLDDLVILPLMIALTLRVIPRDVMDECRTEAEGMWRDGRPTKWYYALPILFVWLIVAALIVKLIWF